MSFQNVMIMFMWLLYFCQKKKKELKKLPILGGNIKINIYLHRNIF